MKNRTKKGLLFSFCTISLALLATSGYWIFTSQNRAQDHSLKEYLNFRTLIDGREKAKAKTYPQENALIIPRLIDSRAVNHDITLSLENGEHEFFPGVKSKTSGFNQPYLGPSIRLYNGEATKISFINNIGEPTTVHGHGLHVAGKVDGGPQSKILPGETKSVVLNIAQEAGTSWYHPHLMGKTAAHTHAGLAGFYLIEDENSQTLALPKEYGVDDIPLVIQDRSFVEGKMQAYAISAEQMIDGLREETLVVNGTINAYHPVPAGWVRLRLLNASNARFYRFFLSDGQDFYKIATEGGFLNHPLAISELTMSPGERNEIMLDLTNQTSVSLMAEFLPADTGDLAELPVLGELLSSLANSNNPVQPVVELRPDTTLKASGTLPERLNDINYYSAADKQAAVKRTLSLDMDDAINATDNATDTHSMFGTNGQPMNIDFINERVQRGALELWTITADFMPHPFHVHGVSFQIITHNGQAPAAADRGWKDTVIVSEEPTEILMRFNHLATDEFPYMYHCHMMEHEDGGMMGQFTVLD